MLLYDEYDGYTYESDCEESQAVNICCVCEREIQNGEACYHFEGNTVCENCCNAYVIDHYWFSSPNEIKL